MKPLDLTTSPLTRRELLQAGAAAGLAPIAMKLEALAPKAGSFRFAYFSDTHVALARNINENLAMLKEIAALRPAFAINGGDVTDYGWAGEYDNYQRILTTLPCKVHHTAGNHDVRWSPQGVKILRERLGAAYEAFEHEGCLFVVLDSTVPLSHWGHYETEQLRWLERTLRRAGREKPVFITTHHWVGRDAVMVDNEETLRQILEPYNVKLILNGHGHSDLLWQWDGISGTMNRGLYQGSWQIVEVDREKGEVRLTRYRTDKPLETPTQPRLVTSIPLAPQRGKAPVWALPLVAAWSTTSFGSIPVPDDTASVRWNDTPWTPSTSESRATANRMAGDNLLAIRNESGRHTAALLRFEDPSSPLKERWRTKLPGGVMSHLRLVDGVLYVSTMDGSVGALDPLRGRIRWTAKTGGYCHSSPTIHEDLVLVGSADASFYAFDRKNGKRRWSVKTDGPVYATAAVAQGVACVGSGDGHFYGIDVKNGAVRWKTAMPRSNTAFSQSVVATDGERFYIGAWDSHLYALDVLGGAILWRKPCMERTFAFSPAIGSPAVANGRVFVPANGNGLFCFDGKTGEQLWMVSAQGDKYGHSGPTVWEDKLVVGGLGDLGQVRCVRQSDGSEVWVAKTGSVIYDSSPAIGDGFAAIGSVGSLLSLISLEDGKVMAQRRLPWGHFLSSPVADGKTVYAGSYSDFVLRFDLA